jgi:hypothetical protein
MDFVAIAVEIGFIGALGIAGTLLLLTYLAFVRMNRDVRRARMFLMADRVRRFLGAFTLGFLLIAAAAVMTVADLPTATPIFSILIFVFLVAIVYGSLELFLIVRPRPMRLALSRKPAPARVVTTRADAPPDQEAAGGDGHATR